MALQAKVLISELPNETADNLDAAVFPVSRAGMTRKLTGSDLADFVNEKITKVLKGSGDGISVENDVFNATYAAASEMFIPAGTYKISPEINLTTKDAHIVVHPDAIFTTAAWDMGALVPIIGANPVLAFDAFYKNVGSSYDLYAHVVGRSIFTVADTTGPVVVSLYANCEIATDGAYGFGANFGTYVTAHGTGVVLELDSHVVDPDGVGVGLAIDSIGSYPSATAIVIQPNGPLSPFNIGISFNNAAGNDAIVTNAIQFTGAGEAQRAIYAPGDMMFTSAVVETNVFVIGPSVNGYDSLLRVDASASGSPKLSAVGSATNIGMAIQTKGTGDFNLLGSDNLSRLLIKGTTGATYLEVATGSGGVTMTARGTDTNADIILTGKGNAGFYLLSGSGSGRLRGNNTGLGFNGTTPIAKPTLSAALSTGGAETNTNIATAINAIRTALVNYGLCS